MDIQVSYPAAGRIRFESEFLFADPQNALCHEFVSRVIEGTGIVGITIRAAPTNGGRRSQRRSSVAEVHYCIKTSTRRQAVEELYARLLAREPANFFYNASRTNDCPATAVTSDGTATIGSDPIGHPGGTGTGHSHTDSSGRASKRPLYLIPDHQGVVRLYRHGPVVSSWQVKHEIPGRLRLHHPGLHRRKEVCQAIERELMSVLGIDNYKTSPMTASVLISYNPAKLRREQIIEIVDTAMAHITVPPKKDKADLSFPLCTVSVPLAAAAQFAFPVLLPVSAGLFIYTAVPSFKGAYEVVVKERRLGVDVLDSIVVAGCLATGAVFAGSILCLCLGFGRILFKKTQDDSKKMLMSVFGKAPRFVWLYRDGIEIETPLERLQKGDLIVVKTGEVVPVDGFVRQGMAMIDQHALTGESTPSEKAVGDRVFASTLMVAGKVFVEVESSGGETTSSRIAKILNDSAGYKLNSQHKGERMADRAVIPTLAIAATALATIGPAGAVAVLNSDFGTGIRMAVPLAMLTSLTLCAHKGILVKDGRALELMNDIDTVLFDKTGTLTREVPEVGRILACNGHEADTILRYAAAAENKFAHPIARAILEKHTASGLAMPDSDESKYQVGYGITVGIEGHTVRVGSARFITMEGIEIPADVQAALDQAHHEGHTLVMVAIDNQLGGALELHASQRPEARDIIAGLRKRGIKHIAIISGDHEGPTKKLAESLGMDRYYAGVLPADKANYVEALQKEGKKVCFVGDGINDSIALKKANVSVSLRGASSIATDTAHIVFMEESLAKLCELRDIARALDKNVSRSWTLILIPNVLCIAGAFTMGFGVMASVVTNNVAALGALANGMLPLRRIAQVQAEQAMKQELRDMYNRAPQPAAAPIVIETECVNVGNRNRLELLECVND
ncbi:MAG: heavy metal translocating P-type ATPase [Planctomycetaceae bacterium]|nr:heavy metal translocating P-type ATPase [Planctomycetaceae bacterium]